MNIVNLPAFTAEVIDDRIIVTLSRYDDDFAFDMRGIGRHFVSVSGIMSAPGSEHMWIIPLNDDNIAKIKAFAMFYFDAE